MSRRKIPGRKPRRGEVSESPTDSALRVESTRGNVGSPRASGLPPIPVMSPRTKRENMGTRVERIPTERGLVGACSTRAPLRIRCVREQPLLERGKPRRVGATPDPRGVSTHQTGEYGDAGGTHPYRLWVGRGVFHPRPTSNPLRGGTTLGGTWEAPACWGYPRFPSFIHTPGGEIWGRGWNASLPIWSW